MNSNEKNRILASSYTGNEENFWFQGRFEAVPYDKDRERRMQWFREARLGMFPHWSPMALVGRGGAAPVLEHMTPEENRAWCEAFRPKQGFADEWVELALAGGMKYIVFTTNHCDALKMWNTDQTDFNSLKIGPGRDLIGESIEAARKMGLKIGLYYSPSEPFAHLDARYIGDDTPLADRKAFLSACCSNPTYAERYRNRIYAEMEELLTRYGKIDMWWNDGPLPGEILPPKETIAHLRGLQPDMIINDRIFGGTTTDPGDFATQDYNENPHHGVKIGRPGRDWETGMPINKSWSWIPESILDTARLRDILHILYLNVSEQGNLLLSVAPKPDGTIDDLASMTIRHLGEWVRDHAEAVYGLFERTQRIDDNGRVYRYLTPGSSKCAKWALKNDTTAFLWVRWWPGAEWPIGHFHHNLKKATLINTGGDISFSQEGQRVLFTGLPTESPDKIARYNIIKLEFEPSIA